MALTPDELDRIAARTLAHYDEQALSYWNGTRDHDVSQNVDALLRHIEAAPPLSILDLGCGPGRDLKVFGQLGHHAVGLEGCPRFAEMARAHAGCEVWQQDFLRLDLPPARFDGIFANASLFHVPRQELPRVLRELAAALRPRGVLFASNPRGDDREGWSGARYSAFHSLDTWRDFMSAAGFAELCHYYRPPGLPLAQQPWLASVWRKAGDQSVE